MLGWKGCNLKVKRGCNAEMGSRSTCLFQGPKSANL